MLPDEYGVEDYYAYLICWTLWEAGIINKLITSIFINLLRTGVFKTPYHEYNLDLSIFWSTSFIDWGKLCQDGA